MTASGFVISPVVGAIPWPVELKPRASEVQEVLPMPLGALASPTLVEVKEALSGNICRCGCYAGIAQAVLHASEKTAAGGGAR